MGQGENGPPSGLPPGVAAIPKDQVELYPCPCGSERFKQASTFHIIYDRIAAVKRLGSETVGIVPAFEGMECADCGEPISFDHMGMKRIEQYAKKRTHF